MMINEFIRYLAFPYLAMVVLIHIAMFLKCATHRRIYDRSKFSSFSRSHHQEERSLVDVIWRRKKNWIESLLREVIQKRPRGRKRLGTLNEFLKESSYAELKRKAENRKEWRIWKPRTCLTAEHNNDDRRKRKTIKPTTP